MHAQYGQTSKERERHLRNSDQTVEQAAKESDSRQQTADSRQ
jgi:hypothetical protein